MNLRLCSLWKRHAYAYVGERVDKPRGRSINILSGKSAGRSPESSPTLILPHSSFHITWSKPYRALHNLAITGLYCRMTRLHTQAEPEMQDYPRHCFGASKYFPSIFVCSLVLNLSRSSSFLSGGSGQYFSHAKPRLRLTLGLGAAGPVHWRILCTLQPFIRARILPLGCEA